MKALLLLTILFLSAPVLAQSTSKAGSQYPDLALCQEQEQRLNEIRAEYAYEISEIAHSQKIVDKDKAMFFLWKERNSKLKDLLNAEQYEDFRKKETVPVFLRSMPQENVSNKWISS